MLGEGLGVPAETPLVHGAHHLVPEEVPAILVTPGTSPCITAGARAGNLPFHFYITLLKGNFSPAQNQSQQA